MLFTFLLFLGRIQCSYDSFLHSRCSEEGNSCLLPLHYHLNKSLVVEPDKTVLKSSFKPIEFWCLRVRYFTFCMQKMEASTLPQLSFESNVDGVRVVQYSQVSWKQCFPCLPRFRNTITKTFSVNKRIGMTFVNVSR